MLLGDDGKAAGKIIL